MICVVNAPLEEFLGDFSMKKTKNVVLGCVDILSLYMDVVEMRPVVGPRGLCITTAFL